ncbi:MAG: 5-dehydro-4-deoxy-D-glucuronate isomerase [Opitutaceae bacterium]|nr:5-dehydro-4-deoxy-D-glucuronate isomerase [Opitutaceae bacterium]
MQFHHLPTPEATNTLSTEELRARFLLTGLFQPGAVTTRCTDLDRMIAGGAVPAETALELPASREMGTEFFLERREIGILNVGGKGFVRAGGILHEMDHLDCLYVGRGERDVQFSQGAEGRAQFYFVSAPAHASCPTTHIRAATLHTDPVGSANAANRRRIHKLIHPGGVQSCQLVMGFTEFEPGSVWNTMPPHTHSRRSEIYLYFDAGDAAIVHLLGQPQATRHVIVRDREAVLSPSWSVHCGAGTGAYRFAWAMAGENQVFADMDPVPLADLK